ncbi:Ferritin heavy chain [Sciurus carolinensis]|uniref:Ferritin heavy chain n=1 Tax=Sciurus carolinensis TaxID=30640 RepID=A0AA41N5A0_SCICA|nr:Ferritin heavy chain [Sciurus carolinensis]
MFAMTQNDIIAAKIYASQDFPFQKGWSFPVVGDLKRATSSQCPRAGAPELPPGLGARRQPPDPPGALTCHVYLSMSYYIDGDDVALKNFVKYFLHQSDEETERAEKPMKLQNQRGGRIFLRDMKKPDPDAWWGGRGCNGLCFTLGEKCESVTSGTAQSGH